MAKPYSAPLSPPWSPDHATPKPGKSLGDYWWINDIVTGEPEYDTMGFKGQFIVVLPERPR